MDAQQLVSSCWFHDLLFHDWPDVSLRLRKAASISTFLRASSQKAIADIVEACVGAQTHAARENAPDSFS